MVLSEMKCLNCKHSKYGFCTLKNHYTGPECVCSSYELENLRKYKHWVLYDKMPNGWWIDNSAGSPLVGYNFIISGSIFKGGERALLKVNKNRRNKK